MRATGTVVVTWVGVAMLAAWSAGCNSPWRTFQAIQVGRPLPAVDPAKADKAETRSKYGLVRVSDVAWPVPLFVFTKRCSAFTGTDGAVQAKSYDEFSSGHWGLFFTMTYHYVLEMDVPPEYFHPVPDDWDGQSKMDVAYALDFLMAMNRLFEPDEGESAGILEDAMAKLDSGATSALAATSQPTSAPTTQGAAAARSAADWLLFQRSLLKGLPERWTPSKRDFVGYLILQSMMNSAAFSELIEDRSALAALTRPGADVRGKTSDGHSYRVRNLGGRRVRVDIEWRIIRDPLLPLLGVEY